MTPQLVFARRDVEEKFEWVLFCDETKMQL